MKNGWYKENGVFNLYFEDQVIETSTTDPKGEASSQTAATQKEGVPSMINKSTPTTSSATQTTTPATTDQIGDREKAVKDLAVLYGVDPDQTWQAFQNMNAYGTMGSGTNLPYGYGVSGMMPYRYKHRGYGTIGLDRGYVPGDLDLRAMEEQAARMGYDFYGKSRPTLFGGRKVVIKTHYNPSTGRVENKPTVVDSTTLPSRPGVAQGSYTNPYATSAPELPLPLTREPGAMYTPGSYNVPTPDQYPSVSPEQMPAEDISGKPEVTPAYFPNAPLDYSQEGTLGEDVTGYPTVTYAYGGGLNRFLPKHQVLGETGFRFDNLDINVPIMDTFHNIKTGLTSIKDFKQQRADARRDKRGYDEKAVWKTGPSPYAADTILTGMSALSNIARGKERKDLEKQMATGKLADNMFTSVEKKRGDYVPTGQEYGMFRPDQTTPIFDTGYGRGYANRPTYGYDRGGSVAYSDWSQTPANGYYGVPTGEMSMYSKWSQAPVMAHGGAMSKDGIEMELTPEEIEYITQMGGQVEFLD